MHYQKLRNLRSLLKSTQGLFWCNAVLWCGLCLPFVVVAATSLKNALALSVGLVASTLPTALLLSFVPTKLPGWLRLPLACCLAVCFVAFSFRIVGMLSPEIFDSVGIFLPLMGVNGLLLPLSSPDLQGKPGKALLSALGLCLGFCLAACLVGTLRELLGNGTVWGYTILKFKLPGILPVFGGFVVVGLLAAGARCLWRCLSMLAIRAGNPIPTLPKKEVKRV